MQWHYTVEGMQKGPVEESILRSLVASGEIGPDDYVWNEMMGDQWRRVAIMRGYKWKLFFLHLRFLGWGLICAVPAILGYTILAVEGNFYGLILMVSVLGFFWLMPYITMANAEFYEDIRPSYRPGVGQPEGGAREQADAVAAE